MARKVVRIGVVGVGGMGQGHCGCIGRIPEAKLTCVCDIDPDVAQEVGKKHKVKSFLNYRELIDSGLCDAVTVATPHYDHPTVGIYAFKKGLHVLTEKPMAVTVSAARRFNNAAKKSGKVFSIMYQMRTLGIYRKAKELIDAGAVGEMRRITFLDHWYRSQAYYDSGTWRATWKGEGGGVLLNQAPHGMDMFTWLAGLPAEVNAYTDTLMHNIEVEDHAEAMLNYPNGATGYYYTSTNHPSGRNMMEFMGDNGCLRISGGKLELFEFKPALADFTRNNDSMWAKPEVTSVEVEIPELPHGHDVVMRNFARAILFGEERLTPGEEGIKSVEALNAIILSSKRKKKVKLPVDPKEYDALIKELCKTSRYKKPRAKAKRETDPQHLK